MLLNSIDVFELISRETQLSSYGFLTMFLALLLLPLIVLVGGWIYILLEKANKVERSKETRTQKVFDFLFSLFLYAPLLLLLVASTFVEEVKFSEVVSIETYPETSQGSLILTKIDSCSVQLEAKENIRFKVVTKSENSESLKIAPKVIRLNGEESTVSYFDGKSEVYAIKAGEKMQLDGKGNGGAECNNLVK